MFSGGLSPTLTEALAELAINMPSMLPHIQDKLMDHLSMVLAGKPFLHPGNRAAKFRKMVNLQAAPGLSAQPVRTKTVSFRFRFVSRITLTRVSLLVGQTFADKSAAIQLALRTLGSFNLQEKLLTEFVRETVVGYLDDEDPYVVVDAAVPLTACNTFSDSLSFRVSCRALCACRAVCVVSCHVVSCAVCVCRVSNSAIRKAAALTCSSLLVRSNKHAPTRGYLAVVIGEVLERLLNVGIADPDPSIRKTVLSCLDARFDHHLAQAENLRSLFIALNDEVFEIRELAILTIGRLTVRNPAYVMPSLRKTLIQLLTELGTLHSPLLLFNAWPTDRVSCAVVWCVYRVRLCVCVCGCVCRVRLSGVCVVCGCVCVCVVWKMQSSAATAVTRRRARGCWAT